MSSCQLFVSVFVNTEKHRWKESNPRDAGLESGPQTIAHRREVKTKQKSRLPPGARLRRLLEKLSTRRSPSRAARTRAQLIGELGVEERAFVHGSQARRQSQRAAPPGLPRVAHAVHDVLLGVVVSRELVSLIHQTKSTHFPHHLFRRLFPAHPTYDAPPRFPPAVRDYQ